MKRETKGKKVGTYETLNDVLVCTPIPKSDDAGSDEYYETWVFLIHGVAFLPVEHVRCPVAVV